MKQDVQVRWMITRDMESVLDIERRSFEFSWVEDDFLHHLTNKSCIAMVAERNGHVVGFMLYQLGKTFLHVLNFAVSPSARRTDVGTAMVEKLVCKLSQQRRTRLVLEVREKNLAAQKFFRSQGFLATEVLRNHYEDTDEDAYVFEYTLQDECESPSRAGRLSMDALDS